MVPVGSAGHRAPGEAPAWRKEQVRMSKQVSPPPPGDKPAPGNPPPPPPKWRHWLLPVGILVALFLWIYLPAVHNAGQTTLSYSQFLSEVTKHAVKTVTIAQSGGTSS